MTDYVSVFLNQQFKDLTENKLVSDDKLMTYLGVQGPVQNRISDNSVLTGPTVDGDEDSVFKDYLCL